MWSVATMLESVAPEKKLEKLDFINFSFTVSFSFGYREFWKSWLAKFLQEFKLVNGLLSMVVYKTSE